MSEVATPTRVKHTKHTEVLLEDRLIRKAPGLRSLVRGVLTRGIVLPKTPEAVVEHSETKWSDQEITDYLKEALTNESVLDFESRNNILFLQGISIEEEISKALPTTATVNSEANRLETTQRRHHAIGIGRSNTSTSNESQVDVQVALGSKYVSSVHAVYLDRRYATPPKVVIKDLKSTNGTYINGVKLEAFEEHQLEEGDIVLFGGVYGVACQFKKGSLFEVDTDESGQKVAKLRIYQPFVDLRNATLTQKIQTIKDENRAQQESQPHWQVQAMSNFVKSIRSATLIQCENALKAQEADDISGEYSLSPDGSITIGRGQEATVSLSNLAVSRTSAVLSHSNGAYSLRSPAVPFYVNGQFVAQNTDRVLTHGDVLVFGGANGEALIFLPNSGSDSVKLEKFKPFYDARQSLLEARIKELEHAESPKPEATTQGTKFLLSNLLINGQSTFSLSANMDSDAPIEWKTAAAQKLTQDNYGELRWEGRFSKKFGVRVSQAHSVLLLREGREMPLSVGFHELLVNDVLKVGRVTKLEITIDEIP